MNTMLSDARPRNYMSNWRKHRVTTPNDNGSLHTEHFGATVLSPSPVEQRRALDPGLADQHDRSTVGAFERLPLAALGRQNFKKNLGGPSKSSQLRVGVLLIAVLPGSRLLILEVSLQGWMVFESRTRCSPHVFRL